MDDLDVRDRVVDDTHERYPRDFDRDGTVAAVQGAPGAVIVLPTGH